MNEFEKNQDKGTPTGQQGDKPAIGQFDKERAQPGQQDQGETKDELAEAGQQGDNQDKTGRTEGEQQR